LIENEGGTLVKKRGILVVVATLLAVGVFIYPRLGKTNPKVDSTGCLECHAVGQFGAQDGSLHGSHSNCADCHDGTPAAGNVPVSFCLACHPSSNAGLCDLVNLHEESVSYDPSGATCLTCHATCQGGTTTTTTTAPRESIKGKRFKVFLTGLSEGCSAATLNFRSDNVLVIDCLDGYGVYLPLINAFTAVYWSNNYYQGGGMIMFLTGVWNDPFFNAFGIAYFANTKDFVVLTGYVLNI
jgi:hypothetical protein